MVERLNTFSFRTVFSSALSDFAAPRRTITRSLIGALSCGFAFALTCAPARAERISPPDLWEPARSLSVLRLLRCGGEAAPATERLAIYRDMQYRYFTTRNDRGLVYDIPLRARTKIARDGRLVLILLDAKNEVFAVIAVSRGEDPVWIRRFSDGSIFQESCRAYRFAAEFIPGSKRALGL